MPVKSSSSPKKSGPKKAVKKSIKKPNSSKKTITKKAIPLPLSRKVLVKKRTYGSHKRKLTKAETNPIIAPQSKNRWESWQTFNPAALYDDGKAHLLYRAIGEDGLSVLGYASTSDGVTIEERLDHPAYRSPRNTPSPSGKITASWMMHGSGGGWGGCEDPRLTRIGDTIYLLYVDFDGASYPRIALTSIKREDFLNKEWQWSDPQIISPPGVIDKSACLFPEKIHGQYVVLHRIFPNILIDFLDTLDFKEGEYLKARYVISPRKKGWDSRKIGAGAPPLKTSLGWLLLYYGVDDKNASQYKIGAMLLDLNDPAKVLYRSKEPILEPIEWYENEGHKAGVAYPCGAVIINDVLHVYYGGADSFVCVATANLPEFLEALKKDAGPRLTKVNNRNRGTR